MYDISGFWNEQIILIVYEKHAKDIILVPHITIYSIIYTYILCIDTNINSLTNTYVVNF